MMKIGLVSCDTNSEEWRSNDVQTREAIIATVCEKLSSKSKLDETVILVAPEYFWCKPNTQYVTAFSEKPRSGKIGQGSAITEEEKRDVRSRLVSVSNKYKKFYLFPGTVLYKQPIKYVGKAEGGEDKRHKKALSSLQFATQQFGEKSGFDDDMGGQTPAAGSMSLKNYQSELQLVGKHLSGTQFTQEEIQSYSGVPLFRIAEKTVPTHFVLNKMYVLYDGKVAHRHRKIIQWHDVAGDYECLFRSGTTDSMKKKIGEICFGLVVCRDFIILTKYHGGIGNPVDFLIVSSGSAAPDVDSCVDYLVEGGYYCQADSQDARTRLFKRSEGKMVDLTGTMEKLDILGTTKAYIYSGV